MAVRGGECSEALDFPSALLRCDSRKQSVKSRWCTLYNHLILALLSTYTCSLFLSSPLLHTHNIKTHSVKYLCEADHSSVLKGLGNSVSLGMEGNPTPQYQEA